MALDTATHHMSGLVRATLVCDHPDCADQPCIEATENESLASLRRSLRAEGWTHHRGNNQSGIDYCPDHMLPHLLQW